MTLFKELQRRNVFRVAIGYLISAWLVAQVADFVLDNIGAPHWVIQTILLLLALGFPLAVFFAWAYEVTPQGIKRESEIDRSQSITHVTRRKLDRAITVMLVLALGYFIWESRFSSEDAPTSGEPAANVASDPDEPGSSPDTLAGRNDAGRQSIAVLPFENRSSREEDVFFTDGIHDDLLTSLARIGSLKVISRTSVERYAETDKSIPEIARELGVSTIMEGAVQRAGETVRINVQLIDAVTDEHLWAEIFDRELTAENLFAIQSEISEAIARELQTTLSPTEQARISQIPTRSTEAYEAYMRGRILMETRRSADIEEALAQFEKAVALDPNFALAWVGVADAAQFATTYGSMSPVEARERSGAAVERALAIDPDLGEAIATKAQLANIDADYDEAERLLRRAVELSPNYAPAFQWLGNQLSVYPERYQEALGYLEHAAELDPQSLIIRSSLAGLYRNIGQYEAAEKQYQAILEIDSGFSQAWFALATLYMDQGRLADAMRVQQQAFESDPGNAFALSRQAIIWLHMGDLERARDVRARQEELNPGGFGGHFISGIISVFERETETAQQWFLVAAEQYPDIPLVYDVGGHHFAYMNQPELALEWLVRSNETVTDPELRFREAHMSTDHACLAGWAMMETGDAEFGREIVDEAIRFMRKDLEDYVDVPERWPLETCLAIAGDFDTALLELARDTEMGMVQFWWASLQAPWWDPVRDDPRFIEIQARIRAHITAEREKLLKGQSH